MAKKTFFQKVKGVLANPQKIIYYLESKGNYNKLSDEDYLKKFYKLKFGRELNLDDPKTFNEKLQWLKLYDRKSIYTSMVDKYEVKKYVADRIGEEYIIPTLGVWDSFDEIDFDALPEQFVLKCTHDSGGLAICKDKSKFDKASAKKKIEKSLKTNYYWHGREWPYKDVKPRIIAEQYMYDDAADKNAGLTDYKFFCLNGKPEFLYISRGLEDHSTAKISFLTMDYEFAPFKRSDYKPFDNLPQKPQNFEKMKDLAALLSKDCDFLRVDLYEIGGKIYFSELTFSPCSGMVPFDPIEYDAILGEKLILSKE